MKLVSNGTSEELTIVQNYATYADYAFTALCPGARSEILRAIQEGPVYQARAALQLCLYFDVYLFLTGQSVNTDTFKSAEMLQISLGFVGALNSRRFIDHVTPLRKKLTRAYVRSLVKLSFACAPLEGLGDGFEISAREAQLATRFESQTFSEERVWLLRGWWTKNKNGLRAHLPLYPMYARLGRAFTQRFHEACGRYMKGRALAHLGPVGSLSRFIASHRDISEAQLLDRAYMALFWRDFLVHHSQLCYDDGRGSRASTIISSWNNHFIPLVREILVPEGLFAPPLGGYPNPRGKSPLGAHSNVVIESGIHVKTKLLTRVPLHLSDTEAVQTLFVDIRRDYDHVLTWAEAEVSLTNARIERRVTLENEGVPREIQPLGTNTNGHKFISSSANPNAFANAAATFKRYGFVPHNTKGREARLLYPQPLSDTARELGLPVTGSLMPYLVILVSEHPAITTSYLASLQLYNRSGVRIGIAKTDGGHYLVGDKARRGADAAEQQIRLSAIALATVESLVRLTDPIRAYMREQGDDDWRYLLLTCGKGFGRPLRIRNLAVHTSFHTRVTAIAEGLQLHCGLSNQNAKNLAKQFSLSRIRASAGTLVYLETQSVQKMAEVLGHKQYVPDLLSRYLPPALQEFFQERWIRIFQNGIIAEALRDSSYLAAATDFSTPEELASFLSRHALRLLPGKAPQPSPASDSEVVFGLDVRSFSLLLGIEGAVGAALEQAKSPTRTALHWAALTRALVAYVESKSCGREDLQEQLAQARQIADPEQMKHFVYA